MKTLEELQELAVNMNYTLEELMYEMLCDSVDDLELKDKEIARLNEIIDELEEYIQLKIIRSENESDYIIDELDIKEIYYKLKELKEEGKE